MKTTPKEALVMNAGRLALVGVATLAVGAFAAACFESDKDACGAGLIPDPNSANCIAAPPPAPDASANDAGGATSDAGDAGDEAGAPAQDFFGKTCASAADCGGNAPICAAPQLPYCTQINCSAGEANAGICPTAGWTCLVTGGGNPSVCFKQ